MIDELSVASIVQETLVPHTAFEKAISKVYQVFKYAPTSAEPICLALIGESRTGKSRALEEFLATQPPTRTSEGRIVPILSVKTPAKPTVNGLAERLLTKIGDPRPAVGTEQSKTNRLLTLMEETRTVVVTIDEFQHFVDKTSEKVVHHVADWLKDLADESRVGLVVSGLEACQAVLSQHEQLGGRFLSPVKLRRFNWNIEAQRAEFVAILAAFHESLSTEFDLPPFDTANMAFRFYAGTGGLIGFITKFLSQLVRNALDAGSTSISLADLHTAHQDAVWRRQAKSGEPNPFTKQFQCAPSEKQIAMALQLGVPTAPKRKRRRRPAKANSNKLSDVLVAA